jgi:hypothetical protein
MCKGGNQTVYKECAETAKAHNGNRLLSNKEIKSFIQSKGGCLRTPLDNNQKPMINSFSEKE